MRATLVVEGTFEIRRLATPSSLHTGIIALWSPYWLALPAGIETEPIRQKTYKKKQLFQILPQADGYY
jgi:hypothetical protein